jgi:excisionase family DNA binding protein
MAKLKDFLTVKEVAKILKKHPGTVRRWIRERKLPAKKLGGKYGIYLVARSDVLEFMIKNLVSE